MLNRIKFKPLIETKLSSYSLGECPHFAIHDVSIPPTDRGNPQVFINGSYLKRSWVRSHENVALLVANSVNSAGDRKIIYDSEGYTKSAEFWRNFLSRLKEHVLSGVRPDGDETKCINLRKILDDTSNRVVIKICYARSYNSYL